MINYQCGCGFTTSNKGRYVQHVAECKGRKEPATYRVEPSIISDTRRSACCDAPMATTRHERVMVCSKCGMTPSEVLYDIYVSMYRRNQRTNSIIV